MITRAQKARLGLFVLLATIGFTAMLVAVLGQAVWEKRDLYNVRYRESVSGIEVGAQVKYNGVRVGRVERVSIDPDDVSFTVVEFSLQAGTPVKADAAVVMNMFGITGLKFLEIRGGTNEAATLEPGDEVGAGTSVIDDLTVRAEALSRKIETAVDNIAALTDEHNRQRVSNLLESLDKLAGRVDGVVAHSEKDIGALLKNASNSAVRLSALLENGQRAIDEARNSVRDVSRAAVSFLDPKRVDGLVGDARATLGDTRGAIKDVRARLGDKGLKQTVAKLDQFLVRSTRFIESAELTLAQSREGIFNVVQNLAEASDNLRDFSRIIRENPALLLGGSQREERRLP